MIDHSREIKSLKEKAEALEKEQQRSKELYEQLIEPLSPEDRNLLYHMLYEMYHEDD